MVSSELNHSARANTGPWQEYTFSFPRRKILWHLPKSRLHRWEKGSVLPEGRQGPLFIMTPHAGYRFTSTTARAQEIFSLSLHLGAWRVLPLLLSVVHGQLTPLPLVAAEAWAGYSQAADSTAIMQTNSILFMSKGHRSEETVFSKSKTFKQNWSMLVTKYSPKAASSRRITD